MKYRFGFAMAFAFGILSASFPSHAQDKPCDGGTVECEYEDIDEDEDESGVKRIDPVEDEGIFIFDPPTVAKAAAAGGGEFQLLSISGWPETKAETVKKCRKVFGKKICINWPQVYKRTSKMQWFAQVSHPKWDVIKGDVEKCNKDAILAGVVAGILAENIAAALAAYEGYMKACLTKTLNKHGKGIKFGIYKRKTPGEWSKI